VRFILVISLLAPTLPATDVATVLPLFRRTACTLVTTVDGGFLPIDLRGEVSLPPRTVAVTELAPVAFVLRVAVVRKERCRDTLVL
jgi:hypothetical protein